MKDGTSNQVGGFVAEVCSALWSLVGMDHILGLASSVAVSSVRWERALGVMEFVD